MAPLSDYWRIRRSRIKAIELAQLLQNAQTMADVLGGRGLSITWAGESSCTSVANKASSSDSKGRGVAKAKAAKAVALALDSHPIEDEPSPVGSDRVDVVMGMLAHEVGHARANSTTMHLRFDSLLNQENLDRGAREVAKAWVKSLEDHYVDGVMRRRSSAAGRYIKAAREFYNVPGAAELSAQYLAAGAEGIERAYYIKELLTAVAVYGQPLPASLPQDVMEALLNVLDAIGGAKLSGTPARRAAQYLGICKGIGLGVIPLPPSAPSGGEAGEEGESQDAGGSTSGDAAGDGKAAAGDDNADAGAGGGSSSDDDDKEDSKDSKSGSDKDKDKSGAGTAKVKASASPTPPAAVLPADLSDAKGTLSADLDAEVAEALNSHAEDLESQVAKVFGLRDAGGSIRGGRGTQSHVLKDAAPHWRLGQGGPSDLESLIEQYAAPYRDRIGRLFEQHRERLHRRVRGVRSGHVSPQRLWRAGMGRDDLFERRERAYEPGLAIALVLDDSSSISFASRTEVLLPFGMALAQGIDRRHHDVWVLTYTTEGHQDNSIVNVLARPEWGRVYHLGLTYDGPNGTPSAPALIAARGLLKRSRRARRLLIHVTDGMPGPIYVQGSNLKLMDAEKSVRLAREHLEAEGIKMMTLLVGRNAAGGDSLSPVFDTMYGSGNWRGVEQMSGVPDAVAALLDRVLAS